MFSERQAERVCVSIYIYISWMPGCYALQPYRPCSLTALQFSGIVVYRLAVHPRMNILPPSRHVPSSLIGGGILNFQETVVCKLVVHKWMNIFTTLGACSLSLWSPRVGH